MHPRLSQKVLFLLNSFIGSWIAMLTHPVSNVWNISAFHAVLSWPGATFRPSKVSADKSFLMSTSTSTGELHQKLPALGNLALVFVDESSVLIQGLPLQLWGFHPTDGIPFSLFVRGSRLQSIKVGSCTGFCYADFSKLLATFHQIPRFVVFTVL